MQISVPVVSVLFVTAAFLLGKYGFHWLSVTWVMFFAAVWDFISHPSPRPPPPPRCFRRKDPTSDSQFEEIPHASTETVDWLNIMLKKKWVTLGPYVNKKTREAVENLLAKKKIPGLKIKFPMFEIGLNPPHFEYVAGYDYMNTHDIVVDFKFSYHGDLAVEVVPSFLFFGIPIGTKQVECSGILRAHVQLLGVPPFVNLFQLAFIGKPHIALDFSLFRVEHHIPGLQSLLSSVVGDALGKMMVLPNKYVLPIAAAAPKRPMKVRVKIVSAEDLEAKDNHLLEEASSDPYIVMHFCGTTVRTATLEQTLNPVYNRSFDFVSPNIDHEVLRIFVWDQDAIVDEPMGECEINFRGMEVGVTTITKDLSNARSGKVHLVVTLQDKSKDLASFIEPGQLEVLILDSKHLATHGVFEIGTQLRILMEVGSARVNSNEVSHDEAEWNEFFLLDVEDRLVDELLLRVEAVHPTLVGKPRVTQVGRALFPLHTLVPGAEASDVWLRLDNNKQEAEIHLQLKYFVKPKQATPVEVDDRPLA